GPQALDMATRAVRRAPVPGLSRDRGLLAARRGAADRCGYGRGLERNAPGAERDRVYAGRFRGRAFPAPRACAVRGRRAHGGRGGRGASRLHRLLRGADRLPRRSVAQRARRRVAGTGRHPAPRSADRRRRARRGAAEHERADHGRTGTPGDVRSLAPPERRRRYVAEGARLRRAYRRSIRSPRRYTSTIRRVFVMSSMGSPSRTMKSALLPGSIVPPSWPISAAELRVAATITS